MHSGLRVCNHPYFGSAAQTTQSVEEEMDSLRRRLFGEDEVPASVREVAGILPSDIDVEEMSHAHVEEEYLRRS